MPKQNQTAPKLARFRALAVAVAVIAVFGVAAVAHADKYDDQINALRAQNNAAQGQLNGLTSAASSYQDSINQLQSQISAVQAQIAANQSQQADLQAKIVANQAIIDTKKISLAATVKAMYLDGQMTTIEQLATSKNLSDYIDKEEYRSVVQNQLNATIKEIAALQAELQKQKVEVELLLTSEKSQNDQLAGAQAAQASLLAYNQAQQDNFNHQISANSGAISDLRRQQIIENTRYNVGNFKGDPGNGGYPNSWAYAAQDSLIDSWGMDNRECVSYTAFRVHQAYLNGQSNRDMPYWGGYGNANQWDDNARNSGIPVDSNPTVGSIAISNAGAYGHAMYVEAVNGNQIYVQQYNQQLNGQYSEGWRYTTGLVFIHF
jgi:peptidoglycan DL-endopeptidase CwlO